MVEVTVDGDCAVFNVEGLHKFWSFRSRLDIPLAHVTDVEANHDQVGRWWRGVKLLGTQMPGVLTAGMFVYHGEMVFWDINDPAKTIIVSLDHEFYKKLIVEVADPQGTVAILRRAIGQRP
jgi:hypothetical protein